MVQVALAFVQTGLACVPIVPAFGLTGRAIGQAFPAADRNAPAHGPTVLQRVLVVPMFGRNARPPVQSVRPIDRPDRKRGHSVPYLVPTFGPPDRRNRMRGHSVLHPVRAPNPLGRSHGRMDLRSARRHSGPAGTTVRPRSARRPIDPDRSRAHGHIRNGRARKVDATSGNKQAHVTVSSQIRISRATS